MGTVVDRISSIPTFRSLRHRNYRLFFTGQLFSLIGSWMQIMGQQWLVYQLTRSSAWLGAIGFFQNIPVVFFSLYAGSLADRMSKRNLVIITQILSLGQAVLIAGLLYLNVITVEVLAVLAVLLGIINAFDIPIRQSFIVELVGKENLTNAIALNSATFNMARIIGPAIGGIVISAFGLEWCFIFNAISFLAVIVSLYQMKIVEVKKEQTGKINVLASLKESMRYIRSETVLVALLTLVAIMTLFGWSYSVLLPVFAEEVLKIGAVGLGNLLTAVGIGAFISAVAVATFEGRIQARTFIYTGVIVFVISVSIFALSYNVSLSVMSLVGVGMGLVAFFATANASIQKRVPDHLRGRVMGLYSLIFQGSFPFGSLLIGVIAEGLGVRGAILIGAIFCGISGIVVYSFMENVRKKSRKM
ncbi:MAG: MFS transporter [Bacteroidota bacterium]|nr:MFS transporter [Bacteroidota bacterium]